MDTVWWFVKFKKKKKIRGNRFDPYSIILRGNCKEYHVDFCMLPLFIFTLCFPYSSVDTCMNCAFYDTSVKFGTQFEHALTKIFGLRGGPSQICHLTTMAAIFQNCCHWCLFYFFVTFLCRKSCCSHKNLAFGKWLKPLTIVPIYIFIIVLIAAIFQNGGHWFVSYLYFVSFLCRKNFLFTKTWNLAHNWRPLTIVKICTCHRTWLATIFQNGRLVYLSW